MQVGEAELAQPIQGVLQRPHMHDPAVAEPNDPDLINPLEAATGRGLTESFPEVGGRAGEPAHDLVALGDQLHELHVDIGEVGPERVIHRLVAGASAGAYSSSMTSRWPPLNTASTSRRTIALLALE